MKNPALEGAGFSASCIVCRWDAPTRNAFRFRAIRVKRAIGFAARLRRTRRREPHGSIAVRLRHTLVPAPQACSVK